MFWLSLGFKHIHTFAESENDIFSSTSELSTFASQATHGRRRRSDNFFRAKEQGFKVPNVRYCILNSALHQYTYYTPPKTSAESRGVLAPDLLESTIIRMQLGHDLMTFFILI